MKKEIILVTNDDGIDAAGINALVKVAQEFGDVVVVAPERGMSGMSHSITMYKPLMVRKIEEREGLVRYACDGTPVDCVKVAMDAIMEQPPTLLLSGINHGANSNLSVIYSGTMGAASEGFACHVSSIGISLLSHDVTENLDAAIHYARKVIEMVINNRTSSPICLNVNVPTIDLDQIKGIKFCRQTKGHWREDFSKRYDPHGREYYWLTGRFINEEVDATDTDEWALSNNYVAAVPVMVDMTDYSKLTELNNWSLK